MFVPAPPPKPINADELMVGEKYWTPSGMGGAYTLTYKGTTDFGKHLFEWEDGGTTEMISEQVPRQIQVCHARMTAEEYEAAGGKYV